MLWPRRRLHGAPTLSHVVLPVHAMIRSLAAPRGVLLDLLQFLLALLLVLQKGLVGHDGFLWCLNTLARKLGEQVVNRIERHQPFAQLQEEVLVLRNERTVLVTRRK